MSAESRDSKFLEIPAQFQFNFLSEKVFVFFQCHFDFSQIERELRKRVAKKLAVYRPRKRSLSGVVAKVSFSQPLQNGVKFFQVFLTAFSVAQNFIKFPRPENRAKFFQVFLMVFSASQKFIKISEAQFKN